MNSERDLQIWDRIFADVPIEWRHASPSQAMVSCAEWLSEFGIRDLLDIGCGVGRWSIWLAKWGFRVWGADFSPNAIAYAKQWAGDEGLDVAFSCERITKPAFADRKFDAVVSALVFDLVSTAEFRQALNVTVESLHAPGYLFAVFNPFEGGKNAQDVADNPTRGVTQVNYGDSEILNIVAGAGFQLMRQTTLDAKTRGFLWRCEADRDQLA